jgi:PAS domain S-box-containing protein
MMAASEPSEVLAEPAERRASESEQRYRYLVDHSKDIILILNKRGKIAFANKRTSDIFGYAQQEMIGRSIASFLTKGSIRRALSAIAQEFLGRPQPELEVQAKTKAGEIRHLCVAENSAPIHENGKLTGIMISASDITERKNAEKGLRQSEEKFRNLAEQSPNMIFINKKGRIVYANAKCEEILGYQREEIYSPEFDFLVLIAPEFKNILKRHFGDHLKGKEVLPFEYAIVGKNGERIEAILATKLIDYENEKAILGIVTDITERKMAEKALREAHDYLDKLLDNASAPIIVWNPQSRIARFNHAFERLTGRLAQDMIGEELAPLFPPDVRRECMDQICTASKGQRWEATEIPIQHKNGTVRTLLWNSATLFTPDGKTVLATIAQGQDITERLRMEEMVRQERDRAGTYLDMAGVIMIVINTDQTISLINKNGCEVLGYPEGEIVGRNWFDHFLPPASREEVKKVFSRLMAGEIAPVEYHENTVLTRAGDERLIAWHNKILTDESGRIYASLSSGEDITERRQAEDEIRRLNAELERRVRERTIQLESSNKELEAFVYSVSHDLRAPLRSIDGFSLALLEEYGGQLDERGRHYLDRVRSAAGQMGLEIEDLLKLSRLTRSEMIFADVNLTRLVEKIAAELKESRPDRAVDWIIAPGVKADGDARLLEVALRNILENAWKFTSKHPSARIEFGVRERDGQPVYFVRDDGAGFDNAFAGKLFGVFQRLHRFEEFEGTGVGLAMVQRIIRRHGGSVWAEGAVERGAAFYFTLTPVMESPKRRRGNGRI